jgi:hypothetical protein
LALTIHLTAIRATAICTKVHEAKLLIRYREADGLSIPDLKPELEGNTRLEPAGELSRLVYDPSLSVGSKPHRVD